MHCSMASSCAAGRECTKVGTPGASPSSTGPVAGDKPRQHDQIGWSEISFRRVSAALVISRVLVDGEDMFPQRPPRLPPPAYTDTSAVFTVAFGTEKRIRVFASADVAAAMAATIREHAEATGTVVYAYCVMPDHVHVLLTPSPTHSVNTFIGQVKNLGQRKAWSLGVRGAFWQRSFWDHCLRESECLQEKIDYILDNPVRAGLTTDREGYPHSGVDAGPSFRPTR